MNDAGAGAGAADASFETDEKPFTVEPFEVRRHARAGCRRALVVGWREVDDLDLAGGHQAQVGDLADDREVAARQSVAEHIEPPAPSGAAAHDRTLPRHQSAP